MLITLDVSSRKARLKVVNLQQALPGHNVATMFFCFSKLKENRLITLKSPDYSNTKTSSTFSPKNHSSNPGQPRNTMTIMSCLAERIDFSNYFGHSLKQLVVSSLIDNGWTICHLTKKDSQHFHGLQSLMWPGPFTELLTLFGVLDSAKCWAPMGKIFEICINSLWFYFFLARYSKINGLQLSNIWHTYLCFSCQRRKSNGDPLLQTISWLDWNKLWFVPAAMAKTNWNLLYRASIQAPWH